MEFGQIPMAPALSDALARAASIAVATRLGEMTLEHFLYALCDDPDAIAVFEASRVDYAQLKVETAAYLSGLAPQAIAEGRPPPVSADVARILEAAHAAARGGRRPDINGAIVLAAIVGDGRSHAAHLLHSQGLTFDEAIRALQRALAPPAHLGAAPIARADDVLARARERVQSRSAPTLREMRGGLAPQPSAPRAQYEVGPSIKVEPYFDAEAEPTAPADEQPPTAEDAGPNLDLPVADPDLPFPGESAVYAERPAEQFDSAFGREPNSVGLAAPEALPSAPTLSRYPEDFAARPTDSPSQGAIAFEIPRPVPVQPPPIPRASSTGAPLPPDDRPPTSPHAPWPEPYASPPVYAPSPAAFEPGFSNPPRTAFPSPADREATPFDPLPSPAKRAAGSVTAAGQLAENIPRRMRTGETERVEVRIAKASVQDLAEGLEGGGAAWSHDVIITKAMSVRMRAPDGGLFIETASPETQWIENQLGLGDDDFASWRFLITPQARGRARLQIVISARTVGADGVAAETALPDQTIDVHVRANVGRAARRLGGWVAAAIAGGALAKFGEAGLDVYVARFLS